MRFLITIMISILRNLRRLAKLLIRSLRRKKKGQYCLQQAQNSGNTTIDTNIVYNYTYKSRVYKDLSYIIYFKYDKKDHYTDKCPKPKKNYDIAKN